MKTEILRDGVELISSCEESRRRRKSDSTINKIEELKNMDIPVSRLDEYAGKIQAALDKNFGEYRIEWIQGEGVAGWCNFHFTGWCEDHYFAALSGYLGRLGEYIFEVRVAHGLDEDDISIFIASSGKVVSEKEYRAPYSTAWYNDNVLALSYDPLIEEFFDEPSNPRNRFQNKYLRNTLCGMT